MIGTRMMTGLCLAAAAVVGCAHKPAPAPVAEAPMAAPEPEAVVRQRVHELRERLIAFNVDTDDLNRPNIQSDAEYRSRMQKVLVGFEEAIGLVTGRDRVRSLNQDLEIIGDAQRKLVNGSADLQADPTVDDGLRAVYRALLKLDHGMFADQPELTAVLDRMGERMRELDAAQGVEARVVARQGAQEGREALWKMESTLAQRVGEGATTEPATVPSTAATVPSTAATAPTTAGLAAGAD